MNVVCATAQTLSLYLRFYLSSVVLLSDETEKRVEERSFL